MGSIEIPEDTTRIFSRSWKGKKANLPKYCSLPELQLLLNNRSTPQCCRCGLTSTHIPACFLFTWTSRQADHALGLSTPCAKRASAPAGVFFHNTPHKRPDDCATSSHTSLTLNAPRSRRVVKLPPPLMLAERRSATVVYGERMLEELPSDNLVVRQLHIPCAAASTHHVVDDVTTATYSLRKSLSLEVAQVQAPRQEEAASIPDGTANLHLRDPVMDISPLPSEEETVMTAPSLSPSVDCQTSSPSMPSTRSVKASRRQLIVDLNEKKPKSTLHDDEQPISNTNHRLKPLSSISSLRPKPDSRTLRRKKHLNIQQPCPDVDSTEPIAISLVLHSSTSTRLAPKSSKSSILPVPAHTHLHVRQHSEPDSIASSSTTTTCTPPASPNSPWGLSPQHVQPQRIVPPTSSPVRLGHPSRPYYSAIRKQGISPPSSRPSSVIGASPARGSTSTSTRPQSYTPPSNLQTNSTSAARHLSMSAMFVTPAQSSGVFSVFALNDTETDGDDDNDEDDDMPMMPPSPPPVPERMSFSLSLSNATKRLSKRKSAGSSLLFATPAGTALSSNPHRSSYTHGRGHGHSQSMSYSHSHTLSPNSQALSMSLSSARAKSKGYRMSTPAPASTASMGFSMSGETELRMALALAERVEADVDEAAADIGHVRSAGVTEDVFRFHETLPRSSPPPPPSSFPVGVPMTASIVEATPPRPSIGMGMDPASRNSFMGRVKKLRKGLKDMLLMNSMTTTTTTMNA